MSHPLLFSHLPFTTSTSSSSFSLPSSTTQEHEGHPVHHSHLQALPVDKLRHQESLWRENLQSGGNTRTTSPTGSEPKELATVPRIEHYSGDPHQLYDVQEKFGEEVHQAPITEEVKLARPAYRIPNYQRQPTSNRRCISTIPWKALQILISKMESDT